jgi:hypothetical protein
MFKRNTFTPDFIRAVIFLTESDAGPMVAIILVRRQRRVVFLLFFFFKARSHHFISIVSLTRRNTPHSPDILVLDLVRLSSIVYTVNVMYLYIIAPGFSPLFDNGYFTSKAAGGNIVLILITKSVTWQTNSSMSRCFLNK